jgi:hypothetical protein
MSVSLPVEAYGGGVAMDPAVDGPRVPLADLVDAVRAQLLAAAARGREQDLQFEVQGVRLDVEVAVEGSREGEGGLKVWVLSVGGKRSRTDTATHKVTLDLAVVNQAGTKFKVSDLAEQPTRRS